MKKAFTGETKDIIKKIEDFLLEEKDQYSYYQVVVEIL